MSKFQTANGVQLSARKQPSHQRAEAARTAPWASAGCWGNTRVTVDGGCERGREAQRGRSTLSKHCKIQNIHRYKGQEAYGIATKE